MTFNHYDGPEVLHYYNHHDNYKVVENKRCGRCDATVVYFSSNGLYYPNTHSVFRDTIENKGRFEWSKAENQFPHAKTMIFLRDIHKQWYLKGINKEIDSFEKIADLIRKHHTSEKLILVGTSAGGYAAAVVGMMLKADAVFSFAGQFTLENYLKEGIEKGKDKLVVERYEANRAFYNLEPLLEKSDTDIFYFICKHSSIDQDDIQIASRHPNIHPFYFNCTLHGVPFHTTLLKKILSTQKQKLIALSETNKERLFNPSVFWKHFFNRNEYIITYGFYVAKNLKKIPRYLLKKLKGS